MASVLDAVKYYQQSIEKHPNDEEKVSMVIPIFRCNFFTYLVPIIYKETLMVIFLQGTFLAYHPYFVARLNCNPHSLTICLHYTYCFSGSKMHRQVVPPGRYDATFAGDGGGSNRERTSEGPWRGGHRGALPRLQMEANGSR